MAGKARTQTGKPLLTNNGRRSQAKMKKQMTILLFALAATVFVAGDARAASWYVDNAVASSGNGQSWVTAYKNFSNIAWVSVHPGDFVYISGGPSGGTKTYTESWSVEASGTAGNPITITVDAANASHNGTAVFDYDARGDNATVIGVTLSGRSYITISGM
jgi:ABC-type hemin transport system substrate-binding protein